MTEPEPISIAVVGVGAMGANHVRVLNEIGSVRIVAVVDPDDKRAATAARRSGARPFSSVDEMLAAMTPQAATVAVPVQDHFEASRQLLEHGCHVLVEKPIAATVTQGELLIQAAEDARRVLMVGHVERFNPAVEELSRRLRDGALGRIFSMSARRLGPFPERVRDTGVAVDLATHDIDIMNMLAGSKVTSVYAQTRRRVHTQFEDLVVGIIHYEDGVVGLLEVNWLTPSKVRELWITGEGGLFKLDYLAQDLYLYENAATPVRAQWAPLDLIRGISEGRVIKFPIRKREPLRSEMEAFLRAVRVDGQSYESARQALGALEIALQLNEGRGPTVRGAID